MSGTIAQMTDRFLGEMRVWTHWQWYKAFFGESVFKFFVSFVTLLPIIAKVFQPSAPPNTATIVETQLQGVFSWPLLWFAAVSYLVAYVLYLVFCPTFIKTYSNYKDYRDHEHSPRWLVWVSRDIVTDKHLAEKFVERLQTKNYLERVGPPADPFRETANVVVGAKQTCLTFSFKCGWLRFAMPLLKSGGEFDEDATKIAEQEVFWEVFGRLSSKRVLARFAVIALLLLSGVLFLIVLVQYFIAMTRYIF
jgi:hypothetical protein